MRTESKSVENKRKQQEAMKRDLKWKKKLEIKTLKLKSNKKQVRAELKKKTPQ